MFQIYFTAAPETHRGHKNLGQPNPLLPTVVTWPRRGKPLNPALVDYFRRQPNGLT